MKNNIIFLLFWLVSVNCSKPLFTNSILENKLIEQDFIELKSILSIEYDQIYIQFEPGPFSKKLSDLIPNLNDFFKKNKSIPGNYLNPFAQTFYRDQLIFTKKQKAIYLESINRNLKNSISFDKECLIKIKANEKPYQNVEPALAIDFYKVKDSIKVKKNYSNEGYILRCTNLN
ncbi:hypothetical protein CLV96_0009 [Leptospira meyeri]|uniref:Uncharacterized protein n=1 Tax=Leptospira meyeri TaxID=29508 RepID=A0A4R8MPY1_LEPME|nr:hypothetical protein [Leptospira meyeri]EKJ88619.1 hypothetical protein LEP1GSC017_3963 [Leptospira meyeri serovar Hardjo str. Went 5]TDY71054.1 hypothetical protein CLV96_0009 [Leptospira meyeri]